MSSGLPGFFHYFFLYHIFSLPKAVSCSDRRANENGHLNSSSQSDRRRRAGHSDRKSVRRLQRIASSKLLFVLTTKAATLNLIRAGSHSLRRDVPMSWHSTFRDDRNTCLSPHPLFTCHAAFSNSVQFSNTSFSLNISPYASIERIILNSFLQTATIAIFLRLGSLFNTRS